MSTQQIENKLRQDAANLKTDMHDLAADNEVRMKDFGNKAKQSAHQVEESAASWVDTNVSQMSDRFDTLTDDARAAIGQAASKLKKNANQSLDQYNENAQQFVDKIPGGFGEKITKYPWVTLSVALLAGLLLGGLFRLIRQSI